MSKILSEKQVAILYEEVFNHPSFARELSDYEKSKVVEYAKWKHGENISFAMTMEDHSQDFDYPEKFKDKEFEYWFEYCEDSNVPLAVLKNILGENYNDQQDPNDFNRNLYLTEKGTLVAENLKEHWHSDIYKVKKKVFAFRFIALQKEGLFRFSDFGVINQTVFMQQMSLVFGDIGERTYLFRKFKEIASDLESTNPTKRSEAEGQLKISVKEVYEVINSLKK